MKKTDSNIFWDKITNATGFIDLISNKLRKNSLILSSSKDIPWYEYFRDQIAKKIKKYNKSSLYIIDGKKHIDKFEDEYEFNEFLAEEYCSYDMRLECDSSTNLPKFMAEHNDGISIHQKYIWIDIYSQKSFENWINFISKYVEYRGKYVEDKDIKDTACFLVSCKDNYTLEFKLDSYLFRDYIESYDYFVFFNLILSNLKILSEFENLSNFKDKIEDAEKDIKTYISEFASNIIKNKYGKNIELITECLSEQCYRNFLHNPDEAMKNNKYLKDIFSHCNITVKMIIDSFWISQLKVIFPILEQFRQKAIKKYTNLIKQFIPKLNDYRLNKNNDYHKISDEMDCELKDFDNLISMCQDLQNNISLSKLNNSDDMLKLNEKKELFDKDKFLGIKGVSKSIYLTVRDKLTKYRNELAHRLRDFSFDEIKKLICSIDIVPIEVMMYDIEKYCICKKLGL